MDNIIIDEKMQKELNAPLNDPAGLDPKTKEFLTLIMKFITEGKINLYAPDTLINHAVYDSLPEDKQGKTDLEATNMLSAIREIKDLHDAGYGETYQMKNLIERLFNTKSRLENEGGDLFII